MQRQQQSCFTFQDHGYNIRWQLNNLPMQQQEFQQWGRERPHSQSRKSCIMPGKAMERCGTREGEKSCSLSTDHITRTDRATIFLAGQHGGASFSLRKHNRPWWCKAPNRTTVQSRPRTTSYGRWAARRLIW